MRGGLGSVVLPAAPLAARGPAPQGLPPARMSDPQLARELERCQDLGLKTYDDPVCRAAQKAQVAHVFGKRPEGVR